MKTKIKTRRRYVPELMDTLWVAGLWIQDRCVKLREKQGLVLFSAFLSVIYKVLFCICKSFRIVAFKLYWVLIGFTSLFSL